MISKNANIDLRPIIDELRMTDLSDTDALLDFLSSSAERIRETADSVSNAKLMDQVDDKAVADRFEIVRSQIRELRLLLSKMNNSAGVFDRLFNVLDDLEGQIKQANQ